MIEAQEALNRLKEGNRRFISGSGGRDLDFEHARRLELVGEQSPFAVVLGCSDSRVPLELVFDQGLGDLFVVRVAGNIAAASQLGSIEFAVEKFDTSLVVVLGHSQCGAISAAVDEVLAPSGSHSPNLASIVERIRPGVEKLLQAGSSANREDLLHDAVEANVRMVVEGMAAASPLLSNRLDEGRLAVIGAAYSLETGRVEFYGENP